MKNNSGVGLVSLQPKFIKRTSIENPDPNLEVLGYDELVEYLTSDKYLPIISEMSIIRAKEGKSEAYTALKRKLPGLAFAGTFKGNYREQKRIDQTSGLLLADMDGLEEHQLEGVYNKVSKSPFVFFCGYSSSGKGLHALIRIPKYNFIKDDPSLVNAHYKNAFKQVQKQFRTGLGVKLDSSVNGVHALMFAGDPRLPKTLNENAKVFPVDLYVPPKKVKALPEGERSVDAKGAVAFFNALVERGMYMDVDGNSRRITYRDVMNEPDISRHSWILRATCVVIFKFKLECDEYMEIIQKIAENPTSHILPSKSSDEIRSIVNYACNSSKDWDRSDSNYVDNLIKEVDYGIK